MMTTKPKFSDMTLIEEGKEMRKFSVVFRDTETNKLFAHIITHEELIRLMHENNNTSLKVCVVREME